MKNVFIFQDLTNIIFPLIIHKDIPKINIIVLFDILLLNLMQYILHSIALITLLHDLDYHLLQLAPILFLVLLNKLKLDLVLLLLPDQLYLVLQGAQTPVELILV